MEQLISACSAELAMYVLKRGPKDLEELTTWAQQYLVAHKQQGAINAVQTRYVIRMPEVASYRCQGYGHNRNVLQR